MATAFNLPVIITNNANMQFRPVREGDLCIPNKLWVKSENRYLKFRERLEVAAQYSFENNCINDGIEIVHNSPEELALVVDEMNKRLDGTWETSADDEKLQDRYNSLFKGHHMGYGLPSRIGMDFLQRHAYLLD